MPKAPLATETRPEGAPLLCSTADCTSVYPEHGVRAVEADRPKVRYSLSTTDSAKRLGSSRITMAGAGTAEQAAPTCLQADRKRTGTGTRACRAGKTCAPSQICRGDDMSVSFLHRIASALMACATRALPSTRAAWGQAMENELNTLKATSRP
jgi:hypothetical protein